MSESITIQSLWNVKFPTQSEEQSLNDIVGTSKYLVVYFYPKDNTPGCTNEAKAFQEHLATLQSLDTAIVGVSRDSVGSHQKFVDKYNLEFPLISDKESQVCNAFKVIKEKSMFGKLGFGIERSTFLLDKEGNLLQEWRKVKVAEHAEAVIEAIKAL
ncbi:MAG: peroxiredoxin [Wohlfahrtiimonas sp.]